MRKINYIRFVIIIISSMVLFSCSYKKQLKKGDARYDAGEYDLAIDIYRQVGRKTIKRKDVKTKIWFRRGESSYNIGDYKSAASSYKVSMSRGYPDSIVRWRYAESLKAQGKYKEAIKHYKIYLSDSTAKNYQWAKNGLKGAMMAMDTTTEVTRVEINKIKDVNSRYHDYSPVFVGGYENNLIFSSMRKGSVGKGKDLVTGQYHGDIYRTWFDIQKGKWERPEPIEENFMINSEHDDGSISMSSSSNVLFFSSSVKTPDGFFRPSIFMSQGFGDEWGEAARLDIVPDTIMSAHPSISYDETKLYFVSDMKGGYGGTDIWMVEKDEDGWSKPINMGSDINSEGDEMFPFARESGELFFCSNFHVGFGGFDLFRAAEFDRGDGWFVENMGLPLNSEGDDVSLSYIAGQDRGAFASNRDGAGSDDIYLFSTPEIKYSIKGVVKDSDTDKPIEKASLRIVGTDGTMRAVPSNSGVFSAIIGEESEYVVAAYKEGYLNDKVFCSTEDLEEGKEFIIELHLKSTASPIEVEDIFFSVASANIEETSKSSLDSLVSILVGNPTITIELASHSDHVGESAYNIKLSQKRAESVVKYLVNHSIKRSRLIPKGYGEDMPRTVSKQLSERYRFLDEGDVLTQSYIVGKSLDEQEICRRLNRRTEFLVVKESKE